MNRRILTAVLILVSLSFIVSPCYAWDTLPIAEIVNPIHQYICVGDAADFDGVGSASATPPTGSYDPDNGEPYGGGRGIDIYGWWYGYGNWDYSSGGTPSHTYDTAGVYFVYLYVYDDDEGTRSQYSDSCRVYVIEVDYVTVNKTIACVNETVTFLADANPAGQPLDCIEWQYRINGGAWESASGGDNTAQLNTSTAGIYQYRARNGSGDTWKDSPEVAVVKVDKVVEDGTTDEGPLYPGCPGTSVTLEAKPNPEGYSFPDGPHWTLQKPGGSSATLSTSTGSTTTLSGTDKWGNYVVTAKCGDSDTGDSITVVFNLVNESGWSYYLRDWGEIPSECPDVNENYCDGKDSYELDDCDNELEVSCCEPDGSDGTNCAYRYYYNDSLVSSCVWKYSPENIFERKIATIEGTRKRYVTKMKHSNIGGNNSMHRLYEGCIGRYCLKFIIYDCITGSKGTYWRRSWSSPPKDIDEGDYCPGH